MSRKSKLASISCALALGLGAAASGPGRPAADRGARAIRPSSSQRSIETQKLEAPLPRASAARPRRSTSARRRTCSPSAETTETELRDGIDRAPRAGRAGDAGEPDFAPVAGVSQSTLDAIAACESGGDPTAVDASGTYYGKYQFDTGTWASVGGSGNPAEASEAEQDYRASLLYSRAGSSPWPVCGV